MSVIVYGPQACGKTKLAEALRAHFGMDQVIDEAQWPKTSRDWAKFKAGKDLLLITDDEMPTVGGAELSRRIYSFVDACEEGGFITNSEADPTNHPLYPIFMAAIHQAMHGKGERHGGNVTPFMEQPWVHYAKMHGRGFLTGQSSKKLEEAAHQREGEAFEAEVLGAIVYAGMAILKERGEA